MPDKIDRNLLHYVVVTGILVKDGKILRRKNLKPEYISLNNIASNSKSKTLEAAYRIVKRLNDCFKENGVPMKIEKKNNLCRLVVQKN